MDPISVLLVDDNKTFLRILNNFMHERQWKDIVTIVGTATNGEEALEQASALKPQVILTDLVMPGLSGFQVIPRLKHILPQVVIVVLTLLDSPDYRQASMIAGADFFVAKENLETDLQPTFAKINERIAPFDGTPARAEPSPDGKS